MTSSVLQRCLVDDLCFQGPISLEHGGFHLPCPLPFNEIESYFEARWIGGNLIQHACESSGIHFQLITND